MEDDEEEDEEEAGEPEERKLGEGFVRAAKGKKCYHVVVRKLVAGDATKTGRPGVWCGNVQERFELRCGSDLRNGFWEERKLGLQDDESLCQRCQAQF